MFQIKLLLSRAEAGRLIGIGGTNIKIIRESSDTTIHLDKDDSKERILVIKGSFPNALKATDLILDSIEDSITKLGGRHIRILCHDRLCKNLVEKGARLIQTITRKTGVRLTVSPVCLPGSDERVVKISEGIGNILDGVKEIFVTANKQSDFIVTRPFSAVKAVDPDGVNTITKKIDISQLTKQHSWRKIYELGDKLGIKIVREAEGNPVTICGHRGGVGMFLSILSMGQNTCNKISVEEGKGENKISMGVGMDVTAAHLAMTYNVPKHD